ncbi:hypothetical protein EZS27_011393 [termite gut metagenome]|uniref:Uncharacterized protein n=1 Tax=termite gut metagenome TaxID=433724 RepID=A0A5J4S3X9_9ZZZZ
MEKKFMKYLLFGVFTFVLGIAFVGCGEDYDDDISSLKNEDVALKSALEKAVSDLQGQITALANAPGGGSYNDIIATINDQIQKLQDAVKKLEDADGTGGGGNLDYDAIADELVKHEDFVAAIIAEISKSNPDLVTLEAKINALITGVTYVGDELDLSFNTVPSLVDYTFGEGKTGAINFAVSKIGEGVATSKVRVRISPASATLTPGNIFLIDNPGSKTINDYVAVKSVSAVKGQLTKADAKGGIYDITFTLGGNYNENTLNGLTKSSNNAPVAFAVAVGNADRYVATDFKTKVGTTKDVTPTYNNLDYNVGSVGVKDLRNRYVVGNDTKVKELVWATNTPKNNVDPTSTTATKAATSTDERNGAKYTIVAANIGSGVKVTLSTKDVLAYYIDFDINGATDDEKTLWQGANITGIGEVYSAGSEATITAEDPALDGKTVGYRVYAVNNDGTYVDPDGRAFYVSYSGKALEGTPLDFVYTVSTNTKAELGAPGTGIISVAGKVTSSKVAFALPEGLAASRISTYNLSLKINNVDIINQTLDFLRYSADNTDLTKDIAYAWADTKYLVINNIDLTKLNDDGAHTGTLTLRDATDHVLVTYKVSLKKVLPTTFPVDKLKLSQAVVNGDGTLKVPIDNFSSGYNILTNGLTISDEDPVKGDLAAFIEYADFNGNTHSKTLTYDPVSLSTPDDASVNLWTVSPDEWRGQDISVTIGYNFGKVSKGGADYIVPSTTTFNLRFYNAAVDAVSTSWSATRSWDGQLVYSKTTHKIKRANGLLLDLKIGDITAKNAASGGALIVEKTNAYGIALTTATLRLFDKDGNYADVSTEALLNNATEITFEDVTLDKIKNPSGGTTSIPALADFTPTKAIFYLKLGTDLTKVEVIGFNLKESITEAAKTGIITEADITKVSSISKLATAVNGLDNSLKNAFIDGVSGSIDTFADLVKVVSNVAKTLSTNPGLGAPNSGNGFGTSSITSNSATISAFNPAGAITGTTVATLLNLIQIPTSTSSESLVDILTGKSEIYTFTADISDGAAVTTSPIGKAELDTDGNIVFTFVDKTVSSGTTGVTLSAAIKLTDKKGNPVIIDEAINIEAFKLYIDFK